MAARPIAAIMMGAAVCWTPQAELELEAPVAPAGLVVLMVVLPTVVTKVVEPEVTVLRTGAVETAEPDPLPPALPVAPPAAPKMVLEPMVEPPETTGTVEMGVAPD